MCCASTVVDIVPDIKNARLPRKINTRRDCGLRFVQMPILSYKEFVPATMGDKKSDVFLKKVSRV